MTQRLEETSGAGVLVRTDKTRERHIEFGRLPLGARVNELLDPSVKAGPTSPFAGKVMREVTISDEHPNPTPIAIVLQFLVVG